MDGHKHGLRPEHDWEPVPGLPAPLPAGERILWQGAPDPRALAIRAFHVRKIAIYFAIVGAAQLASALGAGDTPREALAGVATLAALAAVALGLLYAMAVMSARSTLYTITDRRVVMRVGIVLTMTFNIPLARIRRADLRAYGDGTGDVPLELGPRDTIGYAHLWPHARPWRLRRPEPMLRCVPEGARVGRLLADAWAQVTGGAARAIEGRAADEGRGADGATGALQPDGHAALAGR